LQQKTAALEKTDSSFVAFGLLPDDGTGNKQTGF
jgi:hypothetical protein